jgi:hypothetical protein
MRSSPTLAAAVALLFVGIATRVVGVAIRASEDRSAHLHGYVLESIGFVVGLAAVGLVAWAPGTRIRGSGNVLFVLGAGRQN